MRVLYLIPGVGGGGGAERSLVSMAPHLTTRIDLCVATFSDRSELVPELEEAGAQHVPLAASGRGATIRSFDELMHRVRPDIVHTTLFDADIIGRLAAARRRTPVVSSLVNDRYSEVTGIRRSINRRIVWAADVATARLVVRFHALTQHVADTLGPRLLVPESRIDVIPRGRDPGGLCLRTPDNRRTIRRRLGIPDDGRLVVAAARHERPKGLDVLLRAVPAIASEVTGLRVLIGGRDGAETPELHRLVRELGLEDLVELIGPRRDVNELMAAADTWCVPSRWEGMGSILVEAMGTGVPTVASAIPPIVETAGDPSWLTLSRPEDPDALAGAIVKTLADPSGNEHRAAIGRRRFERSYTSAGVSRQMIAFYERALDATRWLGKGRA